MDLLEMYKAIYYGNSQTIFKTLGVNFLAKNYKLSIHSYIVVSFIIFGNLCGAYTVAAYEIEIKVQCLCLFSMGIQGLSKWLMITSHHISLREVIEFMGKIIAVNKVEGPNNSILTKVSRFLVTIFKIIFLLYCITGLMFYIMPAFRYFRLKERVYILPVFILGVNEMKITGYNIILLFHSLILYMCVFGHISADYLIISTTSHVVSLSDIINNEIIRLNKMLPKQATKIEEIRYMVRNLVLMHKDYCMYIDYHQTMYTMTCTTMVGTTAFAMALTIYCILVFNWIEGYFFFLTSLVQLFFYCALGTLVEIMTDRVYSSIISCKWYLLPLPQQLIIMLMMARAQQSAIICVFGVVPLNMQTFVSVMKSIYTFTIMLLETLNE